MDADGITLIVFWGGLGALAILSSVVGAIVAAIKRREQGIRNELAIRENQLWERQQKLEADRDQLKARDSALSQLVTQKTTGFPWLAEAYDDYLRLQDGQVEQILRTKRHPAPKAADTLKEVSSLRRSAEKKAKVLEYVLRYYEDLFPWLPDLRGEDVDELLIAIRQPPENAQEETARDPARQWLTDAEYQSLSTTERNQLALDRYTNRKKSSWEIGRDYERYVGYQYEREGYSVYYQGIIEGFDDLGRDLIATKAADVVVIQCKYWSHRKTIHEKHINQLFGTMKAYEIDHDQQHVAGVFCTSTTLSDRARDFADKLGIMLVENAVMEEYPRIKCNISRRSGEKIYHLPFYHQYNQTLIDNNPFHHYLKTLPNPKSLHFLPSLLFHAADQPTNPRSS